MIKRNIGMLLIAVLLVPLTACDGGPSIAALKSAVAGFAPLVSILISQGKIPQDKAAAYTKDANDLLDAVGVLQTDWKAATTKSDKAIAIQKFANATAAVVARGDFGTIPQLADAMAILNGIIAIVSAFYGGNAGPPGAAPPGAVPHSEKDLDAYVKAQSEKLKQSLKAH